MLTSVIAWILKPSITGSVASNKIVSGRVRRAKGNARTVDIEQLGEIATTNTVTPTSMTTVARSKVMQSRDLTNTWSQLG